MVELITTWISENYIELGGALLGLVYIVFSVRQNILTWPAGILSSLLYVLVFFNAKFYAGMGLQVYYAAMSIYGWHYWMKGKKEDPTGQMPVTSLTVKQGITSLAIALPVFTLLFFILRTYTDSPVPFLDAFITTLGIIGTWMLARKILFNWIIWIVSDVSATFLYASREMWPTTFLYITYLSLAVYGYITWKRTIQHPGHEIIC